MGRRGDGQAGQGGRNRAPPGGFNNGQPPVFQGNFPPQGPPGRFQGPPPPNPMPPFHQPPPGHHPGPALPAGTMGPRPHGIPPVPPDTLRLLHISEMCRQDPNQAREILTRNTNLARRILHLQFQHTPPQNTPLQPAVPPPTNAPAPSPAPAMPTGLDMKAMHPLLSQLLPPGTDMSKNPEEKLLKALLNLKPEQLTQFDPQVRENFIALQTAMKASLQT